MNAIKQLTSYLSPRRNRRPTRHRTAAVVLTSALLASAHAEVIAPGATVALSGTTSAARPELASTVLRDANLPFEIRDTLGNVILTGTVQDRVSRSTSLGTVIFSPRIRDLASPQGEAWVTAVRVEDYTSVAVNADYRTDGSGQVGPEAVTRSATGGELTFDHDPQIIAVPQSQRFLSILTDAQEFRLTGRITIFAQNDFGAGVFSTTIEGAAAPVRRPGPEVRLLGFEKDEFGSGGILNFEVSKVAVGSVLSIKKSDDLSKWGNADAAPQTVVAVPTQFSVSVSDEKVQEFFRVEAAPPTYRIAGNNLIVTEDTSLDQILIGLNRSGQQFSLRPSWEGPDVQDPAQPTFPMVPKGQYSLDDATELSRQLGLRELLIWETPPAKDDIGIADIRYKPTEEDQNSVDKPRDLPGDEASGRIEEGWNGDNIRIIPESGPELDPGKFEMVFRDPELPGDGKGDLVPRTDLPVRNHIRLNCAIKRNPRIPPRPGAVLPASLEFTEAYLLPAGDGLLGAFPPIPSPNDYVMAVFSAKGEIIHIAAFGDPLQVRVYNDDEGGAPGKLFPFRGAHSLASQEETSFLCTIPLPNGDPNDDLDGMNVVLYQLSGRFPGTENILTPGVLREYANTFSPLDSIPGSEIRKLLRELPRNAPRKSIGTTAAPTVTTLHRSGSNGSKWNISVIGDGFVNTPADQALFNDYVENTILDMFERRDIHPEIYNGINIFRINTFSRDSGITQVNSNGAVTNDRRTALDVRYSGDWNRCWMEDGPTTVATLNGIVNSLAPQTDQTIIVMNQTGSGGCARGNRFYITRTRPWSTVAHEFGHSAGGLGDEYQCSQGSDGCGCYAGGEPGASNLTTNLNRNTIGWRRWIPSWRPIPTSQAHVAVTSQDVGAFAGGTIGSGQWWNCIYRPSWRGRMNNNSPAHNPPGYTQMRDRMRQYQEATFRKCETGDFNGDGRTDLVRLDDRQISLYLADDRDVGPDDPLTGNPPRNVTGVLDPTWFLTDRIRNAAETRSWQTRSGDKYFVGDFDGDGNDDIYVVNLTNWNQEYVGMLKSFGDHFEPVARYDDNLPGWQMRPGDEFYVADFNNDGRDDLLVYNGTNWNQPYFGMLRSTGAGLVMSRRYDMNLPGWEMGRNEKFHVGDFNGDGRDDVIAFDAQSWAQVHFRIYTSNGASLSLRERWYGVVDAPGINWQMRRRDQVHALDFNGDDTTDVAFFNGRDWGPIYLGLYSVAEGKMTGVRRYDTASNPLPGWQMQRRDRHWVGDVNGDGADDLVVYNKDNWNTQYLGMLKSNGSNRLQGSWQDDWIGSWNLGSVDDFKVADFRGSGRWDDLFVFNDGWFGLLRSYSNRFVQETLYRKWITNHRYHEWGWW